MENNKENIICTILIGIPCSGKSSYAKTLKQPIICCDTIREELYGKDYKFNYAKEKHVWNVFYVKISEMKESFIIDNTNIKPIYIEAIYDNCPQVGQFKLEYFPISLARAHYRNIVRYISTGKWIPIKVLNNFHKNWRYWHGTN
jgi:predicted kinase